MITLLSILKLFILVVPFNVVHNLVLQESLPFVSRNVKGHLVLNDAFSDI